MFVEHQFVMVRMPRTNHRIKISSINERSELANHFLESDLSN